jgi:hypothetical protein
MHVGVVLSGLQAIGISGKTLRGTSTSQGKEVAKKLNYSSIACISEQEKKKKSETQIWVEVL